MNKTSLGDFVAANLDALAAALLVAFSTATLSAFMRGLSTLSVAMSLVAAFVLVSVSVPVAAIYWDLPWPLWLVIGVVSGLAGLSIMWTVIRFFDRLQLRAPDIADGTIGRVLPTAPAPKPPATEDRP